MSVVVDPEPVKAKPPEPVTLLPDVCPRSGRIRNFKVGLAGFGAYKAGSILPKHALLRSAGAGAIGREDLIIEKMVKSRKVIQTYEPVNVQLAEVKAAGADPVQADLTRDANTARETLKALRVDYSQVCGERDGWKTQVESRDKSLGEQAVQIAALQAEIAARDELMAAAQLEVTTLTRRVEELTAAQPKAKAVKA